jgi:hypothetical protein
VGRRNANIPADAKPCHVVCQFFFAQTDNHQQFLYYSAFVPADEYRQAVNQILFCKCSLISSSSQRQCPEQFFAGKKAKKNRTHNRGFGAIRAEDCKSRQLIFNLASVTG